MSEIPGKPGNQAQGETKAGMFTTETLQRAETELAQYIGAIAKVIVKRAAAKARFEAELYILIADEIKDPVERRGFIRKAISASERR